MALTFDLMTSKGIIIFWTQKVSLPSLKNLFIVNLIITLRVLWPGHGQWQKVMNRQGFQYNSHCDLNLWLSTSIKVIVWSWIISLPIFLFLHYLFHLKKRSYTKCQCDLGRWPNNHIINRGNNLVMYNTPTNWIKFENGKWVERNYCTFCFLKGKNVIWIINKNRS